MQEFDIIEQFFKHKQSIPTSIAVSIGDDGAIQQVPTGYQLVTSIDTLVSGVHFPPKTAPAELGYKTLAVSLSDMAAMGATPTTVLLALTLPTIEHDWLQAFSNSFFTLANKHNVHLAGGNISQGPLNLCTSISGLLPQGQALQRNGAKAGDKLYVSGTLGDAAAGLHMIQHVKPEQHNKALIRRFQRPTPQVTCGQQLLPIATSAIDISDGLAADILHIIQASDVGADIYADKIPLSPNIKTDFDMDTAIQWALTGGGDYELCLLLILSEMTN